MYSYGDTLWSLINILILYFNTMLQSDWLIRGRWSLINILTHSLAFDDSMTYMADDREVVETERGREGHRERAGLSDKLLQKLLVVHTCVRGGHTWECVQDPVMCVCPGGREGGREGGRRTQTVEFTVVFHMRS